MGINSNFISLPIKYVQTKLGRKSCTMVVYEKPNKLNLLRKNKKLTRNGFRYGWKCNAL